MSVHIEGRRLSVSTTSCNVYGKELDFAMAEATADFKKSMVKGQEGLGKACSRGAKQQKRLGEAKMCRKLKR